MFFVTPTGVSCLVGEGLPGLATPRGLEGPSEEG